MARVSIGIPKYLSDAYSKRKVFGREFTSVLVFVIKGVEDGAISINHARALLHLKPLKVSGRRRSNG